MRHLSTMRLSISRYFRGSKTREAMAKGRHQAVSLEAGRTDRAVVARHSPLSSPCRPSIRR